MKVILWFVAVFGAYKMWQFFYVLFYAMYGDRALGEDLKKCVETAREARPETDEERVLVLAAAIHNAYYYKFGGDLPMRSAELIAERYLNG